MRIIWHEGEFLLGDAPERDYWLAKEHAGFHFHSATATWRGDAEAVEKLRKIKLKLSTALSVSPEALEKYQEAGKQVLSAIEQSRATAVDTYIPVPPGLELMGFQKAGIAYAAARSNVLIADEMGLGKTVQAVCTTNVIDDSYRILILCPATLKLNWKREWMRWTTKFTDVQVVSGRRAVTLYGDVVIVNYDILDAHEIALKKNTWDFLIADECHYLKNETTERSRQVFGGGRKHVTPIPAKRRIFLTGTPILNKPKELWPLLHSIDPQGLGADKARFAKRYCNGFWMPDRGFWWDGATNLEELQAYMRSKFMIRRLKADVLKDLPVKRRSVIVLEPDKSLAGDLKKELMTYEEHAAELRDKDAIALNFEGLSELRKKVALQKVPYVIEHLKEVLLEQEKVVVFVHHHEVGDAIFAAFGNASVRIDGRTPNANRQAAVDCFQTDPACKVFVGGIQSAGVGLTLTASSTVVFAELDWVPGNMSQAEDRCHRIGQKEQVLIQHIVLANSLDERMAETIIAKQEIIEKALDRRVA